MSDYSDIDLCYLWLDYGDSWLKTACTEMLRSAKRAMPGINIIQIGDKNSRPHPFANSMLRFEQEVDRKDLAAFKGSAFAQQGLHTERPTIFCDVDMIFNGDRGAIELREMQPSSIKVGLRSADEYAIIPYDISIILFKPSATDFWEKIQRRCDSCKPGFREWWGDQLAFATMHYDADFFSAYHPSICAEPSSQPIAALDCWATHFAAHRDWLVPYARLLDGGEPFKELMPGLDEVSYEYA